MSDRTFIIDGLAPDHEMEITAIGDEMVFIHSNNRVVGLNRKMLADVIAGLLLINQGKYDYVMTPASAARMALEHRSLDRKTVPVKSTPTLDQL